MISNMDINSPAIVLLSREMRQFGWTGSFWNTLSTDTVLQHTDLLNTQLVVADSIVELG